VAGTQSVLTDTVRDLVSNTAIVVSSVIAMLIISWQLSLIALGIIPVFMYLTVRVGRRRRELTRQTQRSLADLTSLAGETLSVSGVLLAKTFAREREHRSKFEATNRQLTDLSMRQQMMGRAFFIGVQTFFTLSPAIIWMVGGWLLTGGSGSVTIGEIVAFTTLQVRMLFPLAGLMNRGVEISSSIALFDRIFEYMDQVPDIKDPPDPVRLDPAVAPGEVRFDHVSFSYEPPGGGPDRSRANIASEVFALHDVDFVARPGELTAIVGPSGSGKTTVGYLLARLYDVNAGAVRVDGVDVRMLALENLNRLVGVVTQDTFLFHTSVAENLTYGRPGATDDELTAAAQAARIHDTIMAMPDGYRTLVGERGYRMSGGERQRVAIARVVLADPRILLLDEATSSLDSIAERQIQSALHGLMAGRTTIAIAHRLSTILAADCILIMDGGRIVDRGRHRELVERSLLYRSLYEQQFGRPAEHGSATTPASGADLL
jgi:ATP-binding cassette subfamily B protein